MPIAQLEARASQLALHGRINYAYRRLQEYLQSKHTWGGENASVLGARPVAYFSAEFGLHESLPIYSGGLGILAGDHLKSASDLGIPLVGIGLYYDQGYFRQRLDVDGWQHEDYLDVDSAVLPIQPATARDGAPLTVEIETRTGRILARVWRVSVGRNTLLLLDSNVDGNSPEDRQLTSRLYGGDERVRIRQELVLGVGGARALAALDALARRAAPERRAQRLRRARADPAAHGERRHRRRRGLAPRRRTGRLHDAHAGAGRSRPVPAGAGRGASRAAARRARAVARRHHGARARESRTTRTSSSA